MFNVKPGALAMALCATMQDHLYVEMGMRFQDKEVAVFSLSRESAARRMASHT